MYKRQHALTTGGSNQGFGQNALMSLTTGSFNTAIGFQPLANLVSGSSNIGIGDTPGAAYVGSESNNIIIGRNDGEAGESGTIRIGNESIQTSAYMAGVYGVTPTGGTNQTVTVNSATGQLGSTAGAPGSSPSIVGFNTTADPTNVTRFYPLFATGSTSLGGNAYTSMPFAGTLSNLYANVGTNSIGANFNIVVYKNGAPTALLVTIPASTTGVFSDTVDTVTFIAGDTIQFQTTVTGSFSTWAVSYTHLQLKHKKHYCKE